MPKSSAAPRRTPRAARAVLALALVAVLSGCAAFGASRPAEADGRLVVLTTFTVLADLARQVAGDRVEVVSLLSPGEEVHGYEPTPDDLVRAERADLVLVNGLGLERWADRFLRQTGAPRAVLSEGVEPLAIDGGQYDGRANPHAWMSPRHGVRYVENVRRALTRLDPAGAAEYRDNATRYAARLTALQTELVAALATVPPRSRALVTCEGAFSYLAADAGMQEAYLWPVNADAQGTPQQVVSVVEFVRENDVPALFCETTVDDGPQRQVAAETGAELAGYLYVDSLSEEGGPVPSYLALLEHDVRTITAALGGTTAPGGRT